MVAWPRHLSLQYSSSALSLHILCFLVSQNNYFNKPYGILSPCSKFVPSLSMWFDISHTAPSLENEVAISKCHLANDLLRLQSHDVNRILFHGLLVLHKMVVGSKQWTFIIGGRLMIWGSSCRWEWDYVSYKSLYGREVCASLSECFGQISSFIIVYIQVTTSFQNKFMVQKKKITGSNRRARLTSFLPLKWLF